MLRERALFTVQERAGHKARVFITGSADGFGNGAAKTRLAKGHDAVVHVRSEHLGCQPSGNSWPTAARSPR